MNLRAFDTTFGLAPTKEEGEEVTYEGETTFDALPYGALFRVKREDGAIAGRTRRKVYIGGRGCEVGYQYLDSSEFIYSNDQKYWKIVDSVVPVASEDAPNPEPVKPKPLTFGDLKVGEKFSYAKSLSSFVYMKVSRSVTRDGVSAFEILHGWPISTPDSTEVERVECP